MCLLVDALSLAIGSLNIPPFGGVLSHGADLSRASSKLLAHSPHSPLQGVLAGLGVGDPRPGPEMTWPSGWLGHATGLLGVPSAGPGFREEVRRGADVRKDQGPGQAGHCCAMSLGAGAACSPALPTPASLTLAQVQGRPLGEPAEERTLLGAPPPAAWHTAAPGRHSLNE